MGQPDQGNDAPNQAEEEASLAGLSLAPMVAERAAIERALHYAHRRGESDKTTRSKVSKWRKFDEGP